MIIRLRVFGALQGYFGAPRLEVDLPAGATVRDLLDLIDARWGEKLPTQFWDAGAKRFQGPVLMMTNNRDVDNDDMPLSDQQEIWLLVPMAGG